MRYLNFILIFIFCRICVAIAANQRTFTIDYENNQFLKDGKPFRYVSGSIHYFRIHQDDWEDRLYKMKYAGLNAIQTYIEWSSHEPEPGHYDFSGLMNITRFFDLAKKLDLLVILRPGPYICAERDMGGLPYWLLRENPEMKLRTSDPSYLKYVDNWYKNALFPKLKPYLYGNGGPIIMVQVENEYGSFGACDYVYTSHLREVMKEFVEEKAILFTTDGSGVGYLKCGKIPQVYATVDFGVGGNFEPQRLFEPQGPLVNSEFYPGWLDIWGVSHQTVDAKDVASSLNTMLLLNASVNMYMFIGGTNFGLKSGADPVYKPQPTSYDYDAPLTEAGDITPKYNAIKDIIQKFFSVPQMEAPKSTPKHAYGSVKMQILGDLKSLTGISNVKHSIYPLTFEALSVPNGIVVYETVLPFSIPDPSLLVLKNVHDIGYIFVNYKLVGITSRLNDLYQTNIFAKANSTITIMVESMGRVNFGNDINDFKGLTTNVTLNNKILTNWSISSIAMDDKKSSAKLLKRVKMLTRNRVNPPAHAAPSLYAGKFTVKGTPADTFLNMDGWTKGIIWINNQCMGRYWPVMGPQVTSYIPHGMLKTGDNTITLLELEDAPCTAGNCTVTLQDTPIIDGPTPPS